MGEPVSAAEHVQREVRGPWGRMGLCDSPAGASLVFCLAAVSHVEGSCDCGQSAAARVDGGQAGSRLARPTESSLVLG